MQNETNMQTAAGGMKEPHRGGVVLALGMLSLLMGCTTAAKRADPETTITGLTAEETRIVAIASDEVRKRGWKEFQPDRPEWNGKEWTIYLERTPTVPGGHCWMTISSDGKVLEYFRGR